MIVMGSGGVGKSCIVQQFLHGIFVEKYDPTLEDKYTNVCELDGQQCNLEIFDTAGSDQFYASRDGYYREGQCFILVFDITTKSTFDDLEDIILSIGRVKDDTPLVTTLVANKVDLTEGEDARPRAVMKEEMEALRAKWTEEQNTETQLLEASAKTALNIAEIFHASIRRHLASLPEETEEEDHTHEKCVML